jgi:hypothetical protein
MYRREYVLLQFCRVVRRTRGGSSSAFESVIPSANSLFREYRDNAAAASKKYDGKELVLDGVKGGVIALETGDFAVHIPDAPQTSALIATFAAGSGIEHIRLRQRFTFRCTVSKYEYGKVWLEACRLTP